MRILLVQARFNSDYGITNPPLGLMYISAALKAGGFPEVRLLHLDAMQNGEEALRRELEEWRPGIVGIGALTAQERSLSACAALARETLPACYIVAGGPHPTHYYDECLKDRNLDAVIRGEAENAMLALVRALAAGKRPAAAGGLCLRGGGGEPLLSEPAYCTDLDSLPMPDWGAVDHLVYERLVPCSVFAHGTRHMPLMTSRGCPYECVYCHKIMGRRYRAHSPARVLAEIKLLYGKFGVRYIEIMDDNVNLDKNRFREILRLLAAEKMPGLTVYLAGGLHAGTLDEETIDLFRPAGIPYFAIGVETGSPRMQEYIKKRLDLPRVKALIAYAAQKRIFTHGLFMIGIPGEKEEDVRATIDFAVSSELHTALISTCFVYRRTELARLLGPAAEMTGAGDVNHYSGYSGFSVCADVDAARLRRLKFLMNLRFYYSPRRLWLILRDLPRYSPGLLWVLVKKFLIRSYPFK